MAQRRSLGWPITLGTIMIVLLVTLIIGWILLAVAASSYANYWWGVLGVGTTFLLLVLAGVVMYLIISVKEIRPVSGMPSRAAETAKPLMNVTLKPASATSLADSPS